MEYNELIKICVTSLGSLIILFILTKLIGNREMSQLNMFDYINSITIGSIAAEMATALEDFLQPLVAMVVYALATILISYVSCKSVRLQRIITGKTKILLDNGKIYSKNFSKARLEINEFLTQCRSQGYFNINDIQTAILETNGKVSILPKSGIKPVTPDDLQIQVKQEQLNTNIILDGTILKENLKNVGKTEEWLYKEIDKQGRFKLKNIFLATIDENDRLSIYVKINKSNKHDAFE